LLLAFWRAWLLTDCEMTRFRRHVHQLKQCRGYVLTFTMSAYNIGLEKTLGKGDEMSSSIYKIITLVGTSTESWEKAAASAVEMASKTLRDLRIAEVEELDMQLENGKVTNYRAKVKVSFKYEGKEK
jgi:flavin-binding protein dodecin